MAQPLWTERPRSDPQTPLRFVGTANPSVGRSPCNLITRPLILSSSSASPGLSTSWFRLLANFLHSSHFRRTLECGLRTLQRKSFRSGYDKRYLHHTALPCSPKY